MIRVAKFTDIPDIERLLRNVHAKSKYAKRTPLNAKAMNQTVMSMIAAQGQNGPAATHVSVCLQNGQVVGFMASQLSRVYGICEKLVATDVFLVSESHRAADMMGMIDAYIGWASANPKVIEIGLSWSDAISGSHRLSRLYKRKGFKLVGAQFEMRLDNRQAEAA